MIRNYLKTAWRNIIRNKTATLINLFGLSVSLVVFILISLWVENELTFDSYHKDAKNIYLAEMKAKNEIDANPLSPRPLVDAIKKYPDAAHVARMTWYKSTLNLNGRLYNEEKGITVDPEWFDMFDYKIISGDTHSFNDNPYSVIFTRTKAKQLFGSRDAVGQYIKIDTSLFQVRAVIEDNPANSSFQFDMLVPIAARFARSNGDFNDWGNYSYRTFVKLRPGVRSGDFENKFASILQREAKDPNLSLAIQPLHDLHFDTKSFDPIFRRGSRSAVLIFSILALLLLMTASINYINLSIAKSNARTKEISIRKIIGGNRKQLFAQFLVESMLLCVMAMILSLIIIQIVLPIFNKITETDFRLTASSPVLWSLLPGTLIFITLLNGIFPASTMSLFKPLHYLQGYTILKFRNLAVRKGLVVFQFAVGVIFIIGTLVIFLQMRLAQSSAAQYQRAQVVSFTLPYTTMARLKFNQKQIDLFEQTFKNSLLKNSAVRSVALGSTSMEGGTNTSGAKSWSWVGGDTSYKESVARMYVEPATKEIFNLQMKEGRWFSNNGEDRKNFVLNETAVKKFGLQAPVVGKYFAKNGEDTGRIIGVIKDYNFSSLYSEITPMVISSSNNGDWKVQFFANIAPGHIPQTMEAIGDTWKQFIPDAPFAYEFMDQAFDNLYKDDLKISTLALLFSCISISICALGLFGLAVFVAEQRTKEIGIRKIMGATVTQIAVTLSRDFMILVLTAVVIASPVAWWGMHAWLQNFAYRVDISWWIFLAAGSVALIIAVLTISGQAIKAAMANPVHSLRRQ